MTGTREAPRWLGPALEVVVSLGAAAVMVAACTNVKVDPLQRIGQISALASIQVRFLWIVVPLIAALFISAKLRGGRWFPMTSRLTCAAFAGLVTGFVGGGIVVALRGTPYCLNGPHGDMGTIVSWADVMHENPNIVPGFYPPVFPHLLRWYMDLTDQPGLHAMKDLQIIGVSLFGPLAYLSWRLLLRPGWALAIGVVAALVVIDPYKPYSNLVLVALIPVSIRYLQTVRRAGERHWFHLVRAGVGYGAVFGLLCLTYIGWFKWSAPGMLVAGLIVFPWRGARRQAAILVAVTLVVFAIVTFSFWTNLSALQDARAVSGESGPMIQDSYIFFDVITDPAYFAMWKGDLPGLPQVWPPDGEVGGIGVYSLVMFGALGLAVAIGRRRTAVITVACVFAGTWFMRFWTAHYLWNTKLVQLYPRTSIELAHTLLVLAGFAAYYVVESLVRKSANPEQLRTNGMIGAACALAMLFGSSASSIADRYMPTPAIAPGRLAYMAHTEYQATLPPE
ncbi:MAG: hypothetical protein ABI867_18885 [Kofleriaceae bacterium]